MLRIVRAFSATAKRCSYNDGFFNRLMDGIKQELKRNNELQQAKKELEERLQKLSNSEVRKKYDKIQAETHQSSTALTNQLSQISGYVGKLVADIKTTEKAQEALKNAKIIADALDKVAKNIGDTHAYKQVATTAKSVRDEIDSLADVRMYSRPDQLSMRSSNRSSAPLKIVEPNAEAQEIQLHKDSKWYGAWNSFVETNNYVNKFMELKNRFDESENLAVRMLRGVTDSISHFIFSANEISEVLTEIAKIDPTFDKVQWLRFCEKEVVPNILESFIRFDLEILSDWCLERAYNVLSTPIKEWQKIGFNSLDSYIIDIGRVELVSGKMMEQGPVLIISFQVYMVNVIKNSEGKVVEGNPNVPIRINNVWVMCRDLEEMNPLMAWKLLECHQQRGSLSI